MFINFDKFAILCQKFRLLGSWSSESFTISLPNFSRSMPFAFIAITVWSHLVSAAMYAWNVKNNPSVTLTGRWHRICGKRDAGAWMGTGTSGFSQNFVALSSPAVTFVPEFPMSALRISGKCINGRSLKVTHFYVIYEHNSRVCVTFLSSASSDYNDLPIENIIFKYKTSISRLQRQFRELAKSGFFAICVRL